MSGCGRRPDNFCIETRHDAQQGDLPALLRPSTPISAVEEAQRDVFSEYDVSAGTTLPTRWAGIKRIGATRWTSPLCLSP